MPNVSTDITITNAQLTTGAGAFDSATTPAVTAGTGTPSGFFVAGTFDGATVSLEQKIGTSWVALGDDTTLTGNGGGLFTTPLSNIRANVTGAGASFSVKVVIKPIYL
jgi:hypothetical protein|tara:strand:+ start:1088 stop:1411 length:324 start_codon:yes stop_codon:yes gene_type:complete